MTATTQATETTEAAPYSVEEMRALLSQWCVTDEEEARAIATSVCLDRATNWIIAHERDAGKTTIQALETVRDALCEGGA
jgi:hypothetical protein